MPNLTGQSFGRYHILEQLGEGGMATVYKAYDTRLETEVAVKVIRTENIQPSVLDRALKRFEREAKALARLMHPNIVKVSDYGEYEGKPYLVMPYLPGGTLKQKLGKPMPWQDAIQLLLPIAEALDYAHSQNLIHRDVKPSNILLTQSGQPMLTDFGIAKILDLEETLDLTGTSAAVGTPEYMAPEQATAKTVDHRADIYALGVVLYEMVTGRKPFIADTPLAVLFKHASDPLPRPKQFTSDLPDGVEKILLKALAKKPEDRYQSMNALIVAFHRISNKAVHSEVEKPRPLPGSTLQKRRLTLSRRYTGMLVGGIVVIVGLWLGIRLIGNRLASAPIATERPTVTLSLIDVPVEQISTSQTKTSESIIAPTDIMTEASLSVTPTLALGTTRISPVDGMVLHYIPAGTFTMGDTAEHAVAECQRTGGHPIGCETDRFTNEEPIHQVYLDAYWMDETEVTNAKYKLCVNAGSCQRPSTISPYYADDRHGDYPVVFVMWSDASAYCEWAGRRLPTEAEWEKAARGTDGRTYPWGEQIGTDYANYNTSPGDVTKVGSYELGKSPYGLYDMAGNVFEFVADFYDPDYYKTLGENVSNPKGPSQGEGRVIRGGGFLYNDIQSALRGESNRATNEIGFRCALSADIPSTQSTVPPGPVTNILPTQIVDDKGVSMALVSGGEFTMGSEASYADEKPAHVISLDAFYMDTYEVTNALYKECVNAGSCTSPHRTSQYSDISYASYPIVYVDWNQAKTYCEWRAARLPTEAEWEKAARGVDGRTYPWGEGIDCSFANFSGCIGWDAKGNGTTIVGSYKKGVSPYGIHDMSGNVWEWVEDWFDRNYYTNSPGNNPQGPSSGEYRAMRGGSYYDNSDYVRSANRDGRTPESYLAQLGIRCARSATETAALNLTPRPSPPALVTSYPVQTVTPTEVFSVSCTVIDGKTERRCSCNSVTCSCYADWNRNDGFQYQPQYYYEAARSLIELQISQAKGKCQ